MTTFIKKTVHRFFKKSVPLEWYSHDAQKRLYREMGELQKEFYKQGR